MYKYLFRFVVMTLTILTANLLTTAVGNYLISYRYNYKPVLFTFAGMGIIVLIFYPLFIKLEGWVKIFSVKAIKKGNSLAGRYLGLVVTFGVGILILYHFYSKMWYK